MAVEQVEEDEEEVDDDVDDGEGREHPLLMKQGYRDKFPGAVERLEPSVTSFMAWS